MVVYYGYGGIMKTKVECPNCGEIIDGIIEKTEPWWTYYAYCDECGYITTESEWKEVTE